MNTLIDITGFDASRVSTPWYRWQGGAHEGVDWAVQAMKVTGVVLAEQGWGDDVQWGDFCQQFDAICPGWRDNAIVQRLLQAALYAEREYPMRLTDEHWVDFGQIAVAAVEGWFGDTSDLANLAATLGVDPVRLGWMYPVFPQNFFEYVDFHLEQGHGLPDAATIESWYGRAILPEAIIACFLSDFPKWGESIDDIGVFYLGVRAWEATKELQAEDLDSEFVQEILDCFATDEPLTDTQMIAVKKAIDAGVITIEDDD